MGVALNIIHSPKRCTDHSENVKRNVTTPILYPGLKMSKKVAKKTCYKLQNIYFLLEEGGGGEGGGGLETQKSSKAILSKRFGDS